MPDMLSPEEVAAFTARATAHNAAVKEELRAAAQAVSDAVAAASALANKLIVTQNDQVLRLRDVFTNVLPQMNVQLVTQVMPILTPPPAPQVPTPQMPPA